ncbi:MAG TPA: trna delta -isopentenylpyrophosphate transferase [Microvirga sp.]|jgi:hypothetical protein|nr:trna delta -isopentenylpyrophosphate transferase [Microvirga sp.]
MSSADKQIAETLAKFGEPMAGNIWRVQGQAVIYHKALERIAAQAKIAYDPPTLVRAERDEAVILVTGRMGDRVEWSIGEALIGVNYRVSGKQAAYVYAMAEKRAKDRVILKLIELHGLVYSEEEADEFRQGRPAGGEAAAPEPRADVRVEAQVEAAPETTRVELVEAESEIEAALKKKIDKAKSINAVTDLMLHADTQKSLNALSPALRDEVRDYAKAKLMALGWPGRKAA